MRYIVKRRWSPWALRYERAEYGYGVDYRREHATREAAEKELVELATQPDGNPSPDLAYYTAADYDDLIADLDLTDEDERHLAAWYREMREVAPHVYDENRDAVVWRPGDAAVECGDYDVWITEVND